MNVKYDKKTDAMYMEFAKGKYFQTRKVSDSVLVDENKGGKILGVEILNATENIQAFNPKKVGVNLQAI